MSIEDRRYVPTEMCELCFPNGKEIGEIAPNCWLIENEGKYAIITAPGHRGHEVLHFPDKPTPDPDPDNVHEDGPILEAACAWVDKVLDWAETVKLRAETGHFLCSAAEEAGWDHGDVLMWFYNRAGKALEEKNEVG